MQNLNIKNQEIKNYTLDIYLFSFIFKFSLANMHWFIKLRIILAVLKIYPLWAIEWLIYMIRNFLSSFMPELFFMAVVTKKSALIKNVTVDMFADSATSNVQYDRTFWFRYIYEIGLFNDDRVSCGPINLRNMRTAIPFNNIIIDYISGDSGNFVNNFIHKILILFDDSKYYYGDTNLNKIKLISFDTVKI
jgi:hypothetical protein